MGLGHRRMNNKNKICPVTTPKQLISKQKSGIMAEKEAIKGGKSLFYNFGVGWLRL